MLPQISYTSANFSNASAASPCSPLTSYFIFAVLFNFLTPSSIYSSSIFLRCLNYISQLTYLIREPRSVSPRSPALGI